jgi:hypothetical protein
MIRLYVILRADVTFGELFETLRIELNLDKERRDARLSIALVYPKRDGTFSITPITELSTYGLLLFYLSLFCCVCWFVV